MIKAIYKSSILLTLGLFIGANLNAQNNCTETYEKAEEAYEQGNIEKIWSILKPCMENGFDKQQKLDAYKLLIKSSLYDYEKEAAENYMLKFLELEPEYVINPENDPEEFKLLFDQYQTSPLWTYGIIAGVNYLSIRVLEEYGTYDVADEDISEFRSTGVSFHFGGKLNRYLAPGIEVEINPMLEIDEFTYEFEDETEFGVVKRSLIEQHTSISAPISFTYDFRQDKKLRPFLRLGINTSYLLTSTGNLSLVYEDESPNNNENVSYGRLDEIRKRLQFSVLSGIGAKFKIKRAYLFGEVRYRFGLDNQVVANDRRSRGDNNANYEKMFRVRIDDSDFSIDRLSLSIGIGRNIYNPRKRTIKEE